MAPPATAPVRPGVAKNSVDLARGPRPESAGAARPDVARPDRYHDSTLPGAPETQGGPPGLGEARQPAAVRYADAKPADKKPDSARLALEAKITTLLAENRPENEVPVKQLTLRLAYHELGEQIREYPEIARVMAEVQNRLTEVSASTDLATLNQGLKEVAVIKDYIAAVKNRRDIIATLDANYPENSHVRFELDYSETSPAAELAIVKVYQELRGTDAAKAIEAVIADVKAHPDLLQDPKQRSFTIEFLASPLTDLDKIAAETTTINRLYALKHRDLASGETVDSPLQRFFKKVGAAKQSRLSKHPQAVARRDLNAAMASLAQYDQLQAAFKVHEEHNLSTLRADSLPSLRELLIKRAEAYRDFLKARQADSSDPVVIDGVCTNDAFAGAEVKYKIDQINRLIRELKAIDTKNPAGQKKAFDALRAKLAPLAKLESDHIAARLTHMIDEVAKIRGEKSDNKAIERLRDNLRKISGNTKLSTELRVAAFQTINNGITEVATLRAVEARITQYKEYLKEQHKANRPLRALLTIPDGISKFFGGEPIEWSTTVSEKRLEGHIHAYEDIRSKLTSGDTEQVRVGRAAYLHYEQPQVLKVLNGDYEDARLANFTLGVSIVVAAALTAEIGVAAAAPYLTSYTAAGDLTFASQLAFNGVRAAGFVPAERLYAGVFEDGGFVHAAKEMVEKPGDLLIDTAITAGMFQYLHHMMNGFNKFFEKGLETLARRNVLKLHPQLAGQTSRSIQKLENATAAATPFEEAVTKEMERIRQGLMAQVGNKVGGFAYEVGAFQKWQFIVEVGRRGITGKDEVFSQAWESAFSNKSLYDNAIFLLGLRAFNRVALPAVEPALQKIGNASQRQALRRELKKLENEARQLRDKIEHIKTTGQGDIRAVTREALQFVRERNDFLAAVPNIGQHTELETARQNSQRDLDIVLQHESLRKRMAALGEREDIGLQFSGDGGHKVTYTGNPAVLGQALNHPLIEYTRQTDPITGKPIFIAIVLKPFGIRERQEFHPYEAR